MNTYDNSMLLEVGVYKTSSWTSCQDNWTIHKLFLQLKEDNYSKLHDILHRGAHRQVNKWHVLRATESAEKYALCILPDCVLTSIWHYNKKKNKRVISMMKTVEVLICLAREQHIVNNIDMNLTRPFWQLRAIFSICTNLSTHIL